MSNANTYNDFCQAWLSRFPNSELPAAWEEDVRANLVKHQEKVINLQVELEKEEMYVMYLEKLLEDIAHHRKSSTGSVPSDEADNDENEAKLNNENKRRSGEHLDDSTTAKNAIADKQQFLDDQCERQHRSSMHLDLSTVTQDGNVNKKGVNGTHKGAKGSQFVTVINVNSPVEEAEQPDLNSNNSSQQLLNDQPGSNRTYTKSKKSDSDGASKTNSLKKVPPKTAAKPAYRRHPSKESLNSVSSLISPSSPNNISPSETLLLSPREAPASPREHALIVGSVSSSETSPSNTKQAPPKPPERSSTKKSSIHETKSNSSSEDIELSNSSSHRFTFPPVSGTRGRPDGGETDENDRQVGLVSDGTNSFGKVKDIKGLWENKPPISIKPGDSQRKSTRRDANQSRERVPSPTRRTSSKTRKDSDSSSRGRMGSPSGKSHDSSDSDHSWSRRHGNDSDNSPASRRRMTGETRLDRLVRRPSGDKGINRQNSTDSIPPPLPKPNKKVKAKQKHETKDKSAVEPLYDIVANEEPEDDYDNHLLYATNGTNKSDTLHSGNSSTDLGFDEPLPLKSANSGLSLTGSVTLSSSTDTDGINTSPSLMKRVAEMDEEESNYVNIQYFIDQNQRPSFERATSSSHADLSEDDLEAEDDCDDSEPKPSHQERVLMYKHILNSLVESEAIYLECLSVMLQYMKAMKVTLTTPNPIIPKEDFDVIYFKIPELHEFHYQWHDSFRKQVERWNSDDKIGHHFKMLAQQTKVYDQFLGNYPKALEVLHKCTKTFPQFADLTGSIKLRTLKGPTQSSQGQSLSLEDLLHKPVQRVQKNCLSLQDLIKYTPHDHPDHRTLTEALHLIQNFLNEYNLEHQNTLYPHQERQQRHLVKNSFIVELHEGARKLRHLFLFNDVLVCAKYKASGRGEKFTFQLKWYIPLSEALIVEEPSTEPKETKPANLVALKTHAATYRDSIMRAEKEDEWRGKNVKGPNRNTEKQRKNLAELEAQLVLASPNLLFQVSSKSGRTFSFFLSSEFERSQWVETLQVLQANLPPNLPNERHNQAMSMVELQAWITSCRKFLKTNMGSFLMRSSRDEPLLIGDLHLGVSNLGGLTRSSNIFIVVEVDSYGHYFRKAKSRTIMDTMEPTWNDEFIIELEGSENLRILVYEDSQAAGVTLRGKATLELSRAWLTGVMTEQHISMNDVMLTCKMMFVSFEETIRRVPQSKPAGLFKTAIATTTKKEKRAVPFIITSTVREVERRGIPEVGIYRVSGSSADMAKLKKAYETNPYEAEQLLKESDIHAVAGILKQYLRDLPESIFTNEIYQKLFEAYNIVDQEVRSRTYLHLLSQVPHNPNQACVVFLVEHLVRVAQFEATNKMSLHNLATVFGPTMLHAGQENSNKKVAEMLTTSTVDVMAQSGILHYFLTRRSRGEPIQILERSV